MKEAMFKVGDKVYCPSISSDILTIWRPISDITIFDITHPEGKVRCGFVCHLHSSVIFRLDNGRCLTTHYQKIVQATQQNYELLSKLYPNVEFESPPKRKEPKEVIKAMLDDGWYTVPCLVSDNSEEDLEHFSLIYDIDTHNMLPYRENTVWKYAKPFDPKSGKTIIDYIDGQVVLED